MALSHRLLSTYRPKPPVIEPQLFGDISGQVGPTKSLTTNFSLNPGFVIMSGAPNANSMMLAKKTRWSNKIITQMHNPGTNIDSGANTITLGTTVVGNISGANNNTLVLGAATKFMDVIEYTGNGNSSRVLNHALSAPVGSVIIIPDVVNPQLWLLKHRSIANYYGRLNAINSFFNPSASVVTATTDTTVTLSNDILDLDGATRLNQSGITYTMILFAHSPDDKIACGSAPNGVAQNIGFKPKFLLLKPYQQNLHATVYSSFKTPDFEGNDYPIVLGAYDATTWITYSEYGANKVSATETGFTHTYGSPSLYIAAG